MPSVSDRTSSGRVWPEPLQPEKHDDRDVATTHPTAARHAATKTPGGGSNAAPPVRERKGNTMSEDRDPYAEGVEAFDAGKDETVNPYPEGTDEHLSWNDGWNAANEATED